ncbi:ABC transporter permease [Burkholderia sp. SFA1]|uniref:ABC transporter permease n=1 Tax=unclassified Caballeronia TaxID=2646786 RepID=UPI001F41977C|nr:MULTISPECIES: ABC transporter permease subunit [unclassified Caballeronia]MCE4543963.1 ABC transporter permease subunit [Caballeronia sp. PC1]MCE4571114.1 ABC transporter permease subunit [Caballeronia sp. CLC5]BBP98969.1 ABC transporter permease [Burkholderia sp. SFA1]
MIDLIHVSPGAAVAPVVSWLNINHHSFFASVSDVFGALISAVVYVLSFAPPLVTIGALSVLVLCIAGWRGALLCAGGLALCLLIGMWDATLQTIVVILLSVIFSVLVGVPLGVLMSRSERLKIIARPILDMMQTMPPWVYLVPAVILFGLGVVPALLSTIVYGIPPMIRLTILAMSQIPESRIELGTSIGATKKTIFWKIQLPSAMPTLLVGINQCVLFSLAMVVLAGLVGAGGLGAEVTRGLSRMEFGLGMRASLAIVILALVLDRVFRSSIPKRFLALS